MARVSIMKIASPGASRGVNPGVSEPASPTASLGGTGSRGWNPPVGVGTLLELRVVGLLRVAGHGRPPDTVYAGVERSMSSVTAEDLKRKAAEQAANQVVDGMVLGLGTGSTVAHFLELLGERIATGSLRDVSGVPTSLWTEAQAERLGIALTTLGDAPRLDLAVDGADEVGPGLDLIKGMGGALLREKMVAQAAERFLIIADDSKDVDRLGTRSPLPVEVVAWGHEAHARFMADLGAEVTVRLGEDEAPYTSDNGHLILDCRFPGGIEDAQDLEARLQARAGVVDTGLFLGMAHEAVLASADGVRVLGRSA